MKKDNILGITVMGCGLLLTLSVFLPFVSYYSTSLSLWKMEDPSGIIYMLLGVFVIALYLINKKTELSYLVSGYGVFTCITNIVSNQGLEGLSVAFYLILMSSIAIGVITFLYDEEDADSLINLSSSVNTHVENDQNVVNQQPTNNDSINTPLFNESIPNQVEQPRIIKFDPVTGEPVYLNKDNN